MLTIEVQHADNYVILYAFLFVIIKHFPFFFFFMSTVVWTIAVMIGFIVIVTWLNIP